MTIVLWSAGIFCGWTLLSLLGGERERELRRVQDDVKRAVAAAAAAAASPPAPASPGHNTKKVGR